VTTSVGTCTPSCNPTNPTGPILNTAKLVSTVNGLAATSATVVKGGDVIVYTITVTNSGGAVGTTLLTDAVPANTRYTGLAAEGWSCPAGSAAGTPCTQSVTVNAASNVVKFYTLTVNSPLPPNTTTISNVVTSSIGGCTPSCNPSNPTAALATSKVVTSVNGIPATAATLAHAGDVMVYTITVANTGGDVGTTLLTDVVPANTTYTGVGEGWSCPANSPAGTGCTQSVTVNAGGSVSKTYTLTVNVPIALNTTTIGNLVTSSVGTCTTCNPTNPTTTSYTITKSASTGVVNAGAPLSFSVLVRNNGPIGANGSIITDPAIPFYAASGVTCTGTTGGASCPAPLTIAALQGGGMTVATFPPGSTINLVIDGTSQLGNGELTNTVTVSPPVNLPNVDPQSASATVTAQIGVIPTLSLGGLLGLLLLLASMGTYYLRRARR
jgi:uncharacterized repeat protein (TIGR01451 family)